MLSQSHPKEPQRDVDVTPLDDDPELLTIEANPLQNQRELRAQQAHDAVDWSYCRSLRLWGTYLGLVFGLYGSCAAVLAPLSILTYINADLGPSDVYVNIPIAFTAMNAVCFLTLGRLSDLFGRRYFLIAQVASGFIGAIMSGTANNLNTLIGGAVFIGMAAVSGSTYQIYIGELVPIRHRGYWNSLILVPTLSLQSFGPVVGKSRVFVRDHSWRWCYYMASISYGIGIVLLILFYWPPSFDHLHKRHRRMELIKDFDYIGLILFAAGMVLFALGVSWGGGYLPWTSAAVIAPLVIGFVGLVAFLLWQAFTKIKEPLMNWDFLVYKPRSYLYPFIVSTTGGMFYYGILLVWPIVVVNVFGASSIIKQGFMVCTAYAGVSVGAVLGGILFHIGAHHRLKVVVANILMVVFTVGVSQTDRTQQGAAIACVLIASLSNGALETMCMLWTSVSRSTDNIGLSLGLLGSGRSFGGAVAQAIFIAVLNNKAGAYIPQFVTSAALEAGLPTASLPSLFQAMAAGTAEAFAAVPGITAAIVGAVQTAVANAYVETFKYVYYTAIAFGCFSLIFACLHDKDVQHHLTSHIGKRLYQRSDTTSSSNMGAERNQDVDASPEKDRDNVTVEHADSV
ncbi:uncharacterized protein Z518_04621 [Rhinocladiella mackenziei CBS 650.93]|uniref:Major facilitator superfamily (MFS) profile domain-containing protein n=1 Tax=Rhinocladiella mackenziei CBS 650.93 TaxID=1442369 RepID=A0A0D2JC23_9EURO|nr:uncharacterized protein Z518_04621 [Rhinocladiella mackenziei CBS 650.93]KIX06645.1 hypothetical protein Z518_04621 [Rhinocladiella mackenziei CBS 650.93]